MLSQLLESWGSVYANHAALRTGIEFMHIGGLLAGGGCAVTADLATIRAAREGLAARTVHLQLLKRTHRLVVSGLAALATSGVLLFAADVGTFLHSRIFWLKMGLVVLLVVNGLLLLAGERHVERDAPRAWTRLHYTAVSSLVLWFLTALAGVTLTNIG
jgi:hypothetical protein